MRAEGKDTERGRCCSVRAEAFAAASSIILIGLISCYPYLQPGIYGYQPDYTYHLLRIDGLWTSLRNGIWPARIYTNFFRGMGYGSPLFYPDFFLIPAALLHGAGLSTLASYKLSAFGFVILASLSTFLSLRHVTRSFRFSLMGTWLLGLSQFYLADLILRNGYSGYIAYVFIPILLAGIYDFFHNENRNASLIGIGLGGLLLCHTINAFLGLLLTAGIFLFELLLPSGRKAILQKRAIRNLFLSALATAGITAWYLFPLLEQLTSGEDFNVFHPWADVGTYTQPFVDFFDLTGSFFNIAHVGLGIPIWFVFLLSLVLMIRSFAERKKGAEIKGRCSDGWGIGLFLLGIGLLLAMTRLVPWNLLSHTVFNNLQFTFRIYPYALNALVFGMMLILSDCFGRDHLAAEKPAVSGNSGCGCTGTGAELSSDFAMPLSLQSWLTAGIAVLCLLFAVLQNETATASAQYGLVTDELLLSESETVGKGEWLPSGFDPETMISDQVILTDESGTELSGETPYDRSGSEQPHGISYQRSERTGGSFRTGELPVLNGASESEGTAYYLVPDIFYKGYCAELETETTDGTGSKEQEKISLPVSCSGNGLLLVENNTGRAGTIRVYYRSTPVQVLSLLISLGTLLLLALRAVLRRKRKNVQQSEGSGSSPASNPAAQPEIKNVIASSTFNKTRRTGKGSFFLFYSLFWLILAGSIAGWFLLQGKSMIDSSDGYEQHIRALMAYGKWLRGIWYTFRTTGRLNLQNYSFGLGYGGDLYTSLQYYAIGDPLNLPVGLLPTSAVYWYYQILIFLRSWLAGLSFSALCRYKGHFRMPALLTGSLSYAFCGTVLFLGMWNPFFVNSLILLPLLILGAEKVLTEQRPRCFILAVFLAGVTNFYFFYMLVLLTILYCVIRTILLYHRPRAVLASLLRFLLYGLSGTLSSMFLLLPVILAFLTNPRESAGNSVSLLYPLSYYRELVQNLVTYLYHPEYDTELGLTFLVIPVLAVLILHARRHRTEAVIGSVLLLMLLVPAAGYAMNGFAYMINRWTFAVSLYLCWLITALWEELFSLTRKEKRIVAVICAGYLLLALLSGRLFPALIGSTASFSAASIRNLTAACLLLCMELVLLFSAGMPKKAISSRLAGTATTLLAAFAILLNGFYANSSMEGNLPDRFLDVMTGEEFLAFTEDTEVTAMEKIGVLNPADFHRYSGRNLTWNASLLSGTSSTQFYWSLANGAVSDFFREMAVNEMASFSYFGLDDRAALMGLTSTDLYSLRYDTPEERRYVPAGYVVCGTDYNFGFYRSEYALPLGYTYDQIIDEDQYLEMTPEERQEALLHGVVLKDHPAEDTTGLPAWQPSFSSISVPFTIDFDQSDEVAIQRQDSGFVIQAEQPGATVHLSFDGVPECETYLYLEGMTYEGEPDSVPLTITESVPDGIAPVTKTVSYKQPSSEFYSGWHDYLVNLGYLTGSVEGITLTFPEKGTYAFDDIQVICQPAVNLLAALAERHACTMTQVELNENPVSFTTDTVAGSIDLPADRILVVTIPWQKGWTLYVDGVKTDLFQANTMFTGAVLPAGHHDLVFRYETPGLKAGLVLSLLGLLMAVVICRRRSA